MKFFKWFFTKALPRYWIITLFSISVLIPSLVFVEDIISNIDGIIHLIFTMIWYVFVILVNLTTCFNLKIYYDESY